MQKHGFKTHMIASAALALAFTFTAQAQNNRSFVATTGIDTNACTPSAYCRTFARALAVTNSGGEIVVVNSGGYGPFTITQPVTITAIGIDASITATSGNAITVNTSGNVTITGLNLNGGGSIFDGVFVAQVGVLRLYNMQIQNFGGNGIEFASSGHLEVEDSKISDCQSRGLIQSAGQAYVNHTEFNNNEFGAEVFNVGNLAIADSSAQYNGEAGFYVATSTATLYLYNDRSNFNGAGIEADAGQLYFADCLLTRNTIDSWFVAAGATLASSNPATNRITPGQNSGGTLSTAIVLN